MDQTSTTARSLPGKPVADAIFEQITADVAGLRAGGVVPSLATVLVGDDDASAGYIRIKQRTAQSLGFVSPHVHLPADATQDDLHRVIDGLNADPAVHALLIQHPVPPHLDNDAALAVVDPDKDVDGMHPLNLGRLALDQPAPRPCTPAGIEALLAHHDIPVAGREVVVLGRGATLGRPLAMLLAQKRPTANAAVTVVHTGVPDWPRYTQRAERFFPTSTSVVPRSPQPSPHGWEASDPRPSQCSSATPSRQPRWQPGREEERTRARPVPLAGSPANFVALAGDQWLTHVVDAAVVLGQQGRLVIPADIRAALGLAAGDRLHPHLSGARLVIQRPEDAVTALPRRTRDRSDRTRTRNQQGPIWTSPSAFDCSDRRSS